MWPVCDCSSTRTLLSSVLIPTAPRLSSLQPGIRALPFSICSCMYARVSSLLFRSRDAFPLHVGANVWACDRSGRTPLHWAAVKGAPAPCLQRPGSVSSSRQATCLSCRSCLLIPTSTRAMSEDARRCIWPQQEDLIWSWRRYCRPRRKSAWWIIQGGLSLPRTLLLYRKPPFGQSQHG